MGSHLGSELVVLGYLDSTVVGNLKSAYDFPEVIDTKLAKDLSWGRIIGPYAEPPTNPVSGIAFRGSSEEDTR